MASNIIQTAAGDGELRITVDEFGQFGSASGVGGNAFYDPLGTTASSGTTFRSYVALGIIGVSGSRTGLAPLASDNEIFTNANGNTTNSTFTTNGLQFQLNQVAQDTNNGQSRTGSRLDQTYTVTNTTGQAINFDLVRYVDGDLLFDGSLIDGGGRLTPNGQEILFETDIGGTGQTDTTFFGITGAGGVVPTTNRWELDFYSTLNSNILGGRDLQDRISRGDANSDQFIDSGAEYDVALGLRNVFSLAPGESTTYTTTTRFGSGEPVQLDIAPPSGGITELPATTTGTNVNVAWNSTDPSGIRNYDVFVSANGGAFTPFQTDVITNSATYTGEIGSTYTFYSLATDNAGNEQLLTTANRTFTQLVTPPVEPPVTPPVEPPVTPPITPPVTPPEAIDPCTEPVGLVATNNSDAIGNDIFIGGASDDMSYAGEGNDTILGSTGNDLLGGDAGNDKLYGGVGNDTLWGWTGDDLLSGGDGNDILGGDAGKDSLYGCNGQDTIYGGDENDLIFGGTDGDLLVGDAGNDSLEGEAGSDTLFGGIGNDILNGGADNDSLSGEDGNDVLYGIGLDTFAGGNGDDIYGIYNTAASVIESTGEGNDTVWTEVDYTLAVNVENLYLVGNANGTGNDSNNVIAGYRGGNNTINGGAGADTLTGGDGADIFAFQFGQSSDLAADRILDFAIGTDKIDLLTLGGVATSAPTSFSRASDNSTATTLQELAQAVYADADGALTSNQSLAASGAVLVVSNCASITGTYLVIDDGVAGFSANDTIVNITGFSGNLPALGTLSANSIFA